MNEAKKIAPRNQVSGERIRKLLCFAHNAHHFNPGPKSAQGDNR